MLEQNAENAGIADNAGNVETMRWRRVILRNDYASSNTNDESPHQILPAMFSKCRKERFIDKRCVFQI
jgi:hypothetical protein